LGENVVKALVTGGAGFIGSALVRLLVRERGAQVLNLDKLTYAGSLSALQDVDGHASHRFVRGDICDTVLVAGLLREFQPDAIVHLAAESHVDRSIDGPGAFVTTNVSGTATLLSCALHHWEALPEPRRSGFRFLHVSTDEVFGSLGPEGTFTEATRYDPRSPYSASKAAADHLARAWFHTYGLPVVVSNCSNNYGPYQFPEKLIPLMVVKALAGEPLPVYGRGENVRDWLHVDDHVRALALLLEKGRPGETYNIGGSAERRNIEVVESICSILDAVKPRPVGAFRQQISFVPDRPGHDFRYAMDATKIRRELGWAPSRTFEDGLRQTVLWYCENEGWWRPILATRYGGERLGSR
jgi:dTDP-glucose 4,6-dehydratase